MVNIKAPEGYISDPGCISAAGEKIKKYADRCLIVGGVQALQSVNPDFSLSLDAAGITYETEVFTGYPTYKRAREYAARAKEIGVDAIIGVGGGRACDVSKIAADIAKLPVITVPTIAATCASWAAVCIIYTQEGDFERVYPARFTPRLIIADPEVLVKAPERYIKAGIVDTYAKWYELRPGVKGRADSLPMQLSYHGAELARDILDDNYEGALEAVRSGRVNKAFQQVVDAVIFLAGFVGTFVGARAFSGFAHPFYHCSRRIPESRPSLHGELVAFGILAQLVMEGRSEEEIAETIRKFGLIDEAFTLEDLGLDGDRKANLDVIARRTLDEFGEFQKLGFGFSVEEIYDAMEAADGYVRKYRTPGD